MTRTRLVWALAAASVSSAPAQELLVAQAPPPAPVPKSAPAPRPASAPIPPDKALMRRPPGEGRSNEEALYDHGARMLHKKAYEEALRAYSQVASGAGAKAEGAAYWQAYALYKMGRMADSLNKLSEFAKNHPGSRWLNDAKALEMEVRRSQGQNISPEQQADEELKLMALAGLMANGASGERVVPVLRKILDGTSTVPFKEQALFVLAQSETAEARDLLAEYAKGKGNPDLQMTAISMYGMRAGKNSAPMLVDIYKSSSDPAIKRRVLEALGTSGASEHLLQIVKSEADPNRKADAIRALGHRRQGALTPEAAKAIYENEQSRQTKEAVLDALAMRRDGKTLAELFRSEKDVKLKQSILHRLQMADAKAAQELMLSILEK